MTSDFKFFLIVLLRFSKFWCIVSLERKKEIKQGNQTTTYLVIEQLFINLTRPRGKKSPIIPF